MKILFASSEIAPYFRTGGLAEVAGSLPAALHRLGAQVAAVMPLYPDVGEVYRKDMKTIAEFTVQLSWRNQYCGVKALEQDGVTHYFIDNEYYFNRPFAYGQYDDAERFAFYSMALLEMLPHIGFIPDIIHCNDWQTGLVPVYLQQLYDGREEYCGIRSVFTIHNIEYQGQYDPSLLGDVFGLPEISLDVLQCDGFINLLKGGIAAADHITTVSQTYSREILTPEYARGLDGILRENAGKLSGILNGIDTASYDPATDPALFVNYAQETHGGKGENKEQLQRMLGLDVDGDIPLIGIVSRLASHKGIDLIAGSVNEMLGERLQLAVLGTGEWRYEQLFTDLAHNYPHKVSAQILFNNDMSRKIYAAGDMFLMPSLSEPCGLAQMIALRYGTIPIVHGVGGLADTVENLSEDADTGNGFVFGPYNSHDMLLTIRRALGLYADKPLWQTLVRRAMACDFGWGASASQYMDIYHRLAPSGTGGGGVTEGTKEIE